MIDKSVEVRIILKMVRYYKSIKIIKQFSYLSKISSMTHDYEYPIILYIN